jgi:glycerol-3-phosphate cytidylyltransferase-like family protein
MSKQKAIIVSGYFIPLHKCNIEYINSGKYLVDNLFVIVNNEQQRALKGSNEFQEETERLFIVCNLKAVDHALPSIDSDRTVCATIAKISKTYWETYALAFANGVIKTTDRFQKCLFVKNSPSL